MNVRLRHAVLSLLVWLVAVTCHAGTIGQWSGSLRSWNHPDMAVLRAALESAGHTVAPDGPISSSSLADRSALVVAEPTVALTTAEAAALDAFVRQGGILIVLGETSSNLSLLNGTLTAVLGSPLSYSASPPSNSPLVGGDVAVDGPPANLAGQSLAVSNGRAVGGGVEIAGTYARTAGIGLGKVYAFGDRIDHDSLVVSGASTNAALFVNLLAPTLPGASLPVAVPVLSPLVTGALSLALAAFGGAGLRLRARRRDIEGGR